MKNNDQLLAEVKKLRARVAELEKEIIEATHAVSDIGGNMQERIEFDKESLNYIVNNASDGIAVGYPDGRIGMSNEAYQKITGYTEEELKSIDWNHVLTPPEWLEYELSRLKELHETRKPVKYEKEYIQKSGKRIPIELVVHARTNPNGELDCYFVFVTDITDRKKNKLDLREREELLRQTQKISKIGGWEYDVENKKSSWTDEVYEIYGVSKEFDLNNIEKIIAPFYLEDQKKILNAFWAAVEKGESYDLQARFINLLGKDLWVRTVGRAILKDEKVVKVQGNFIDITDQKRIEIELLKSKAFNETLLNNSPDVIYIYDIVENKNVYSNEGINKVLGYSVNEIQEMGTQVIPKLMHPDDFKNYLEKIYPRYEKIKDGELIDHKYRMKHKKGHWCCLNSRESIFLRDSNGTAKQIFGILIDITERMHYEKSLEEKNEFIDKIIESTALSTWISDEKGTAIRANPASLKFFGAKKKDVIGKYNLFKDEVIINNGVIPEIKKMFNNGEIVNILLDYDLIKGGHVSAEEATHKTVNSIFTPIIDDEGKVTNVIIQSIDLTEIKKAENEIIKAKNEAERYLDMAGSMILSLDVNGNIVMVNQKGLSILEYERTELIGKNWFDLCVPKEINTQIKKIFSKVVKGNMEGVEHYDNDIVTKSGKYKRISWYNTYIKNKMGEVETVLSSGVDTTDIEKAQKDLIESESRLKLAGKIAYDLIYEWDIKTGTLKWFGDIDTFLGYDKGEISFNIESWLALIHSDDQVKMMDAVELHKKSTKQINYNYRIRKKSGEWRIWNDNALPLINEKRTPYKWVGVCTDITDLKKSEKELRESKEQFELAMNASRDGLFDWNLLTNEIYYSPGWKRMLGYEDNELSNDISVWQKLANPEEYKKSWEMLQELMNKQRDYFRQEFRMKHKAGHWVDILSRAEAFFDKNWNAIRIVGTHVNISERKRVEKELIRAKEKAEESDRLKSAFLANMSHEIRTPMNGILGFTRLLKKTDLSGESQQKYIEIIQRSGYRMLNTINDIIEISKIETEQVTASLGHTNVNEIIDNQYDFFVFEAEQKGIKLNAIKKLAEEESIIISDGLMLSSILTNLIKNAIKYSQADYIEFGYNKLKDYLQFFVKDTGVGIKKNRQEFIFDRFIQADINDNQVLEGSGLGLSIAKAYVGMLSGKIWLESEEGLGSKFCFTIPYIQVDEIMIHKTDELNGKDYTSMVKDIKILVVEDDDAARFHLSIILEDVAREIIYADNGIKAIEICKQHEDINLILMDIKIPGMNGYETTKKIREFNKDVIIIAQTAYAFADDYEKAKIAGCDDYISKPLHENELIELINKTVKTKANN